MEYAKGVMQKKWFWAGLVVVAAVLIYHAPRIAGAIPLF